MALVEVARFLELTEAQAAVAALRASGVPVFLGNENLGQTVLTWQHALGGFQLWTREEDAGDVRAFLRQARRDHQPAVREPQSAAIRPLLAFLLTFVIGPSAGCWMAASLTRRRLLE